MTSTLRVQPPYLNIKDMAARIHSGAVYLLQGPRPNAHVVMEEIMIRFALRGRVDIVTGGNWVSFDRLPLLLHEGQEAVYEILDRIQVSRAETPYQMVDVLTWLKPSSTPLIIPDMLDAFDDDDLTEQEANLLLQKCISRIDVLRSTAPILISINTLHKRDSLVNLLEELAYMHIYVEAPGENLSSQMQMVF